MNGKTLWCVVNILAFAWAADHAQAQSFTGLGSLPGGDFRSTAYSVSGDGSTVTGFSASSSGSQEAYLWTQETGMISVGTLGWSQTSRGNDLSYDGSVMAGQIRGGFVTEAFRWDATDGLVELGFINSGDDYSTGRGINADGSVIVGTGEGPFNTYQAYRWTEATGLVGLGDLPGGAEDSFATATSADGSVVVGAGTSELGREAMRWTEEDGMVGLGDLDGDVYDSVAFRTTADGSVIVGGGNYAGQRIAFRWTEEDGMIGLGDFAGGPFGSVAHGVSADGSVIVGQGTTSLDYTAFLWDEEDGFRNLQTVLIDEYGLGEELDGWHLQSAFDISDDGSVIVGSGTNPDGNPEAWRVVLIPEPATSGLLLGALALLGYRRRFRPVVS